MCLPATQALFIVVLLASGCNSGEDDTCIGVLGVEAAPATWHVEHELAPGGACAVEIRPDVVFDVMVSGGRYGIIPSDPAVEIGTIVRQPQVGSGGGCVDAVTIHFTDTVSVDGTETPATAVWSLLLADTAAGHGITGTLEGTAGPCTFSANVTGSYAL
jgi:hypothetical protein